MEAVIHAIDDELRSVTTALEALKTEYAQREAALNARREALNRARELVLPHTSGDDPTHPQRERTNQAGAPRGPDAEAVEHLYPPNGGRAARV